MLLKNLRDFAPPKSFLDLMNFTMNLDTHIRMHTHTISYDFILKFLELGILLSNQCVGATATDSVLNCAQCRD